MTVPTVAHQLSLDRTPDGWQATCLCGWISVPSEQPTEAIRAQFEHVEGTRMPELLTNRLLTPRQLQVLSLASEGLTDGEIAHELGCSILTIYTHMEQIRRRLGAISRTQAAVFAIRIGLIPLDPAHPEQVVSAPTRRVIVRTGVAS